MRARDLIRLQSNAAGRWPVVALLLSFALQSLPTFTDAVAWKSVASESSERDEDDDVKSEARDFGWPECRRRDADPPPAPAAITTPAAVSGHARRFVTTANVPPVPHVGLRPLRC